MASGTSSARTGAPTRQQAIRVFVISDQRILAWGLERLVADNAPALRWAGSATSRTEALASAPAARPDITLLDLDLHSEEAVTIARLADAAGTRVLALTRQADQSAQDRAILDGAHGILDRQASPETFLEAIDKVHRGQFWLDRAATGRIFVELSRRGPAEMKHGATTHTSALTAREKTIVACIFDNSGDSAKLIAEKLNISESTLRNHLTSIYSKLGIANRFELIAYALKHGQPLTLP